MLGGVTHQFVGVFLQSYGYFSIGRILEQWSQYGLFDFILPFLLIFALVFGVLSTMNLFKDNKAVNGIIALAVALMSLQFGLVPAFFAELWPRFGVGIAIYLVFLILVGFFIDPKAALFRWMLIGTGAAIVVIILINTAGSLNFSSANWWYDNWPIVALGVFLVVVIGVIVGGGGKGGGNKEFPNWWPIPTSGS